MEKYFILLSANASVCLFMASDFDSQEELDDVSCFLPGLCGFIFTFAAVPTVCGSGSDISALPPRAVVSFGDNVLSIWWSSPPHIILLFQSFPGRLYVFFWMNFRIKLSYSKTKQSNNKNASFENRLAPIVESQRHKRGRKVDFLVYAVPPGRV